MNSKAKTQSIDTTQAQINGKRSLYFISTKMYYSKENWVGADHCYRFCRLRLPSLSVQFHRNTRAIVAGFLLRKLFAIPKKRGRKKHPKMKRKKVEVTILCSWQSTQTQRTGRNFQGSAFIFATSDQPFTMYLNQKCRNTAHTRSRGVHTWICAMRWFSCCFTQSRWIFFSLLRPKTLFAQWTYLHIME